LKPGLLELADRALSTPLIEAPDAPEAAIGSLRASWSPES
jgi:hypothetical protein